MKQFLRLGDKTVVVSDCGVRFLISVYCFVRQFLMSHDRFTSGIVAQLVGSNPIGIREFFFFSVWAHFLSRAIVQKVLLAIFIQHFNLPHLNYYIFLTKLAGVRYNESLRPHQHVSEVFGIRQFLLRI